ncbi:MAG: response regulator [Chthoniobacter sp.]|uniref:response regulator transcription factor n=1 Tax=Chthoniobacter sp. TaxID=2510640 RepID=UPI0032AC53BB
MRVLIADDDKELAQALADCVTACGHDVVGTVTGGGLAVIQAFARCEADAVLLDIMMPRYNGLTVCHALLSRKPDAKIIFVSGSADKTDPFVTNCGAAAYLEKPVSLAELRETLDALQHVEAA